jgi:hypothetical protein
MNQINQINKTNQINQTDWAVSDVQTSEALACPNRFTTAC